MRREQINIYEALKKEILEGGYRTGSLLPSEESVARLHSVSRPTIAKIYNQLQEQGYIRKTRGHGSEVIYVPAGSTHTIGLLLPSAGESEIFSVINDQLHALAKTKGVNYLWDGATAGSADMRKLQIEQDCAHYLRQGVDAIVFSPLERLPDAEAINVFKRIISAGVPLVLLDRGLNKQADTGGYDIVSMDNFLAGQTMAQHLIGQGCEKIYFFHRPYSANSVDLRISGVRDKVLSSGLRFGKKNIICGDPLDTDLVGRIDTRGARTGIVCANDSTAAVLLTSLESIRVRPRIDCLICGFDDMKYAQYLKYPLTTYLQPCEEMASVSLELAIRRIKNKSHVPVTVNIAGRLLERASSIFLK